MLARDGQLIEPVAVHIAKGDPGGHGSRAPRRVADPQRSKSGRRVIENVNAVALGGVGNHAQFIAAVAVDIAEGRAHGRDGIRPIHAEAHRKREPGGRVIDHPNPLVDGGDAGDDQLFGRIVIDITEGQRCDPRRHAPPLTEAPQWHKAGGRVVEHQDARAGCGAARDGDLVAAVAVDIAESNRRGILVLVPLLADFVERQKDRGWRQWRYLVGNGGASGRHKQDRRQQGEQEEQAYGMDHNGIKIDKDRNRVFLENSVSDRYFSIGIWTPRSRATSIARS